MIILLMKMMKKIDPNHIDDKNWHDKTNIDNDKYDDLAPTEDDTVTEDAEDL